MVEIAMALADGGHLLDPASLLVRRAINLVVAHAPSGPGRSLMLDSLDLAIGAYGDGIEHVLLRMAEAEAELAESHALCECNRPHGFLRRASSKPRSGSCSAAGCSCDLPAIGGVS
jgi:hypothetical protein